MSIELRRHRAENRFRCRACATEFCAGCLSTPYHLGFTCDSFVDYKKARHCRYCNAQLTAENSHKKRNQPRGLEDVCTNEDCTLKRNNACGKVLECGHLCCGIKNENACTPCLEEECCTKRGETQNREDYCNICWVEDLASAPSIRLECGHYFHHACALKQIRNKWPTPRIIFNYLECPLCKQVAPTHFRTLSKMFFFFF